MFILIPEKVDFEISTTDLIVKYSERNKTLVILDVLDLDNYLSREIFKEINIEFNIVAEVRCCSLNFFEAFYEENEIICENKKEDILSFWKKNGYNPDSGLYQIKNSELLNDKQEIYDPQGNLNLHHYLIVGNDSYVEIVASSYEII